MKHPKVRRADRASKSKVANLIRVIHRDEVEAPLTDWMQEAYELSGPPPALVPPHGVDRVKARRPARGNVTGGKRGKAKKKGGRGK